MENFSPIFVDDSECDDRSNDQYIMTGQKKQSLNCGLSGRASGGPLFIHLSIYPISVPVDAKTFNFRLKMCKWHR